MKFRSTITLTFAFCSAILVVVAYRSSEDQELRKSGAYEGAEFEEEEHEGADEPLKFFQFHREIRMRETESEPGYEVGYRSRALKQARAFARANNIQARTKSNGVLAWTERGPGNVPGRTRALMNIPNENNLMWLAGAATGGIWKTFDGGSTWHERNDNLTALPISSFAATTNGEVIYAGTGELISSGFSAMGDGIFKSVDEGENWSPMGSTQGNPDFAVITRLIVDPEDANTIVATTAGPSSDRSATKSSIMRTNNGGGSWTKVREITGTFDQVVATPGNFQVQYASENGIGTWKSVDGGLTWNLSNTGMSVSGRIELAVSPVNTSRVFASAEGALSGTESDLYVSDDAGDTWSLVDVTFNGDPVDFLGNSPTDADSQGYYDNTILCDPFDERIVYFGGISLFQSTTALASDQVTFYVLDGADTESFLTLIDFGADAAEGKLDLGSQANETQVEIRFGPGKSQQAHRFLVPAGSTSGVPVEDYAYQNMVNVPFEVWDVDNNRQLMASFRDQGRDGQFNLVESSTIELPAETQSREYIYVHNVPYSITPDPGIATNGGHEHALMYNIWPVLTTGATWPPPSPGTFRIAISAINKVAATTITVADGYGNYDSKNIMSQTNAEVGVHVDHHTMISVITEASSKTYKVLLGNDGGVFVSDEDTKPGTTQGSWKFKGYGYNTSQFYGADKKPGADRYIGGLQDNGTRISPSTGSASAVTPYSFALGGDGFEVIWNNQDENKILGSVYFGQIYRSDNGGATWSSSTLGLGSGFPFVTRLDNSKDFPSRVFTVSTEGVYVSNNFGRTWKLTSIPEKFVNTNATALDVEVSRANANIVWAGSGMSDLAGSERKIFVSLDGGTTFNSANNFGVSALGSITKLASHPTEPGTAYVLFSFARGPKIIRTKDLGQSWQDISGFNGNSTSSNGFPDVAVYSLYVRPDNPSILWAGTEVGIMESQDDGETWSLLEDFPKVSVWDMKGQDNQVVIATHGRGIWTASLTELQSNFAYNPEITAHGTAPDKAMALRMHSAMPFDSVAVYVDDLVQKKLFDIPSDSDHDIALDGISPGNRSVYLISYLGGSPYQSKVYSFEHLDLLAVKDSYVTYFGSLNDLTVKNVSLQVFPNLPSASRKNLQSTHPYAINTNHSILLRTPIRINAVLPKLFYADLAIIATNNDSVVVEATRNGLDWIPITPAYDASRNPIWENAYVNNQPGMSTMLFQNEIDLSETFSAGDSLLFRMRMISGSATPGWGWAVDFISIQELPVGTEVLAGTHASVFPNPASHWIDVSYFLKNPAEVRVVIFDLYGRVVLDTTPGFHEAGVNQEHLNINPMASGTYLLQLSAGSERTQTKFIVQR